MKMKNAECKDKSGNYSRAFNDFIRYQNAIAERWLQRGNETEDIFSKFFFYFSGFNALYFLWKEIEIPHKRGQENHIENLLEHFSEDKAQEILNKIRKSISYFSERRPIQRMERRKTDNLLVGNDTKGSEYKKILQNKNTPEKKKIIALGKILYFVRCNLVHGSKTDSGDDTEIIENSIKPLKIILEEAILWTKFQCP